MRRFRIRRRRALALALVPAAVMTTGISTAGAETAERQAAISPAQGSVRFGQQLHLRGGFPGAQNAEVAIEYRAAGTRAFRRVATTRTDGEGRWTARVKPRATGSWRARLASTSRTTTSGGSLTSESGTVDSQTDARRVAVRSVMRVAAKNNAIAGQRVRISGRVRPGGRRRVIVKVGGNGIATRTNRRGRFEVTWQARSTGTYRVKARAHGNRIAAGGRDRGGPVTVYRRAYASWYGPGFYGNRTACGQTLTPSTMGVAHKTMPCGTKLKLRHGGRTVRVTVIDRGPYHGGREFDLTEATKNALGFGSTGTVLTSK